MKKKNKKTKKQVVTTSRLPRFEFIFYEESLDPRCIEFKEVVKAASKVCNSEFFRINTEKNEFLLETILELSSRFPDGILGYMSKKQTIEYYLSALIYTAIDKEKYSDYIKNCMFFVEHHGGPIFKIKVSSMRRLLCFDNYAYFPQNRITFKYEGENFDLGFSKHALDRCYERLVLKGSWHQTHHLFFQFMCRNLYVEKAYVIDANDSRKKKISAALYRPLFPDLDFDNNVIKHVLSNECVDHQKYQYYLKVGYAPLIFDKARKTAKATTVLFTGMGTTPEQKIFTDQDRSRFNEDLLALSRSFRSINNKDFVYDNGAYFWDECIKHGFKLIEKKERSEIVYRGSTFFPKNFRIQN